MYARGQNARSCEILGDLLNAFVGEEVEGHRELAGEAEVRIVRAGGDGGREEREDDAEGRTATSLVCSALNCNISILKYV